MAIWQVKTKDGTIKWRARLFGTDKKRLNGTFASRTDAELWVAKVKQQRAQVKAEQGKRDRSAVIDARFSSMHFHVQQLIIQRPSNYVAVPDRL